MKKSNNQIIKEIIKELNLKGKDKEAAGIMFNNFLKNYRIKEQAKQKTIFKIKEYLNYRNNKKNN